MLRNLSGLKTKNLRALPDVEIVFSQNEMIEVTSPTQQNLEELSKVIFKELKYLVEFQKPSWKKLKDGTYSIPVIGWEKNHAISILENNPSSDIAKMLESIAKKAGVI